MWFEVISKLKINLEKSELILVGRVPIMEELVDILRCKVGLLPSNYLGLPLGSIFKLTTMWDLVRMQRKLARWKKQYLSKKGGGGLILIKSTLSSLSIYFMSIFVITRRVCYRLEKLQRDFLWRGGPLEHKPHLVS